MTTHFIAPGDRSFTFITGTRSSAIKMGAPKWPPCPPGGSARPGKAEARLDRAMMSIQLEPEELRGVLRGDLAHDLFRRPGEDAMQELLGPRPGRLGVREVAPPQHVVDADLVAQLDPEIVLHELDEHVAPPVVARQQAFLRPPALREHRPLAVREVHLLQSEERRVGEECRSRGSPDS